MSPAGPGPIDDEARAACGRLRAALGPVRPERDAVVAAGYDLALLGALAGLPPLLELGLALRARPGGVGAAISEGRAARLREAAEALAALLDQPAPGAAAWAGILALVRDPAPGAPTAPVGPPIRAAVRWIPSCEEHLLDPFLDEAGERLEHLSQQLVQLEVEPARQDLLRDVFRALHTLKGGAGLVGLAPMSELVHRAEDLVGRLGPGGRAVDRVVIDALLLAVDGLRAILEQAARRAVIEVDLEPIVQRLVQAAAPAAPEASVGSAAPDAPAAPLLSGSAVAQGEADPAARQTLRVDFDKLDLLLNLVGELVVTKSRLHTSLAVLLGLSRDLDARLRRARRQRLGPRRGPRRTEAPHRVVAAVPLDDLTQLQRALFRVTHDLTDGGARLDHVSAALRDQVMKLRMVSISRVFTKHYRTVRELSRRLNRRARLVIDGADTELDKMLVEQLDDSLMHLVHNALDHGIEPEDERRRVGKAPEGVLGLHARHRGGQVIIEVKDDGRGIDPEFIRERALCRGLASREELLTLSPGQLLELIFRPGFSTAKEVSEISGRGIGMDVVRQSIERLKGSIEVQSSKGQGTTFVLRLPLTLAIIQVLCVQVAGEMFALPLDAVLRVMPTAVGAVRQIYDRDVLVLRGGPLGADPSPPEAESGDVEVPLIDLGQVLGLRAEGVIAGARQGAPEPAAGQASATAKAVPVREIPAVKEPPQARRWRRVPRPPRPARPSPAPCRPLLPVVLVELGGVCYGLLCDRQLGKREIVIKGLGELLEQAPCTSGATLIDDRVVLLLDLMQVVQRALGQRPPAAELAPLGVLPGLGSAPGPAPGRGPAEGAPARVLVVDDSPVEREALSQLLREQGYAVVTAKDGLSAAVLAERGGFDLIATDLIMPGLDGYELTRRLRAQPGHREVPILMITSRTDPLDRVRGFDAGVDEYLHKPVEGPQFLGAVRRHLERGLRRPAGRPS